VIPLDQDLAALDGVADADASWVAPPEHSTLQNPVWSVSAQAPTMSSVAIRVAISD